MDVNQNRGLTGVLLLVMTFAGYYIGRWEPTLFVGIALACYFWFWPGDLK